MSNIAPNLIVVIRTVGERTFDACHNLVTQQISESCVHIVSEQPFEATLRRCYNIGIESNAKWMMTLDADVLLRENAIHDFLKEAENIPENYFQVEGLLHDKLMGLYRKVGHRMYRIKYLEKALECLPQPRETIRPEYTTLLRMEELGYLSLEIGTIFGIHDYEQYLCDIYRKAFVHAQKHPEWIARFIALWKADAYHDQDYRIALRGLYDGLMDTGRASIDKRDFINKAKIAIEELNLKEKDPQGKDISIVAEILAENKPEDLQPVKLAKETKKTTILQAAQSKYQKLGAIRFIAYSIGAIFTKIGNRITKISEPP